MTDSDATITSRLEGLRSEFPKCRLAVFVDLSTGMVLSASAIDNARQEALEDLCDAGVEVLNSAETALVHRHFSGSDVGQGLSVISHQGGETRCFIRSSLVEEDALCLMCESDVNVAMLIAKAAGVLQAIGREG